MERMGRAVVTEARSGRAGDEWGTGGECGCGGGTEGRVAVRSGADGEGVAAGARSGCAAPCREGGESGVGNGRGMPVVGWGLD
jgi:hypothetical protein